MKSKLFLLCMVVALAGCSGAPESSGDIANQNQKNELSDQQSLKKNLEPAIGFYTGKITLMDANQQVTGEVETELALYWVEEPEGRGVGRQTMFLPLLKARFLKKGLFEPYYILEASYYSTTGQLIIGSSADAVGEKIHMSGVLNDGKIDGTIGNRSGTLGRIHLELKSKQVATAMNSSELYAGLRKDLDSVAGKYLIEFKGENPFGRMILKLSVSNEKQADDTMKPILEANFLDSSKFNLNELAKVDIWFDGRIPLLKFSQEKKYSVNASFNINKQSIEGTLSYSNDDIKFVARKMPENMMMQNFGADVFNDLDADQLDL